MKQLSVQPMQYLYSSEDTVIISLLYMALKFSGCQVENYAY
jgi:hypothetical protein